VVQWLHAWFSIVKCRCACTVQQFIDLLYIFPRSVMYFFERSSIMHCIYNSQNQFLQIILASSWKRSHVSVPMNKNTPFVKSSLNANVLCVCFTVYVPFSSQNEYCSERSSDFSLIRKYLL
jgi:hypothetical protein